jgi:hypothetical protein
VQPLAYAWHDGGYTIGGVGGVGGGVTQQGVGGGGITGG